MIILDSDNTLFTVGEVDGYSRMLMQNQLDNNDMTRPYHG